MAAPTNSVSWCKPPLGNKMGMLYVSVGMSMRTLQLNTNVCRVAGPCLYLVIFMLYPSVLSCIRSIQALNCTVLPIVNSVDMLQPPDRLPRVTKFSLPLLCKLGVQGLFVHPRSNALAWITQATVLLYLLPWGFPQATMMDRFFQAISRHLGAYLCHSRVYVVLWFSMH